MDQEQATVSRLGIVQWGCEFSMSAWPLSRINLIFQSYCTVVLWVHGLLPCLDDRPKLFRDLKQVLELLHSLHLLCRLVWAAE